MKCTMQKLNQFKYDVLAAISGLQTRDETPYGIGIRKELEAGNYDDMHNSRVYMCLKSLEGNGYITRNAVDRRTNRYELTNKGMGALRDRIGGLQDMMDGKVGAEA